EIDTFISDVSTTNTNIAMASSTARPVSPPLSSSTTAVLACTLMPVPLLWQRPRLPDAARRCIVRTGRWRACQALVRFGHEPPAADGHRAALGVAYLRPALRRRRRAPGSPHARARAGERRALPALAGRRRLGQAARRAGRRQ